MSQTCKAAVFVGAELPLEIQEFEIPDIEPGGVLVAVLVAVADRAPLPFASSRTVRWVALTSYSVYMTQATSFDAYQRLVGGALPGVPQGLHLLGGLALVGLVGSAFYLAVERPTLWLRRRVAPRRTDLPSPLLATPGRGQGHGAVAEATAARAERKGDVG